MIEDTTLVFEQKDRSSGDMYVEARSDDRETLSTFKSCTVQNYFYFDKIFSQNKIPIHTIRKVKFLSKNLILTKPNIFTSFSPKIFLTIFLVKSKLSTAKKSKPRTFSRVFHSKKLTIFSGNQS